MEGVLLLPCLIICMLYVCCSVIFSSSSCPLTSISNHIYSPTPSLPFSNPNRTPRSSFRCPTASSDRPPRACVASTRPCDPTPTTTRQPLLLPPPPPLPGHEFLVETGERSAAASMGGRGRGGNSGVCGGRGREGGREGVAPFGYGHFDSYNERNKPKTILFRGRSSIYVHVVISFLFLLVSVLLVPLIFSLLSLFSYNFPLLVFRLPIFIFFSFPYLSSPLSCRRQRQLQQNRQPNTNHTPN